MKKEYTKPTMSVVELQHRCQLLAGSVNSLTTNLDDIVLGDGSDVDAR
ncbi:MAG: hypothetical protein IJQ49_04025 [Prevotella sp.]|jgi:hypothetical protein|nr:hypothetical protein [Prevotella sp.]